MLQVIPKQNRFYRSQTENAIDITFPFSNFCNIFEVELCLKTKTNGFHDKRDGYRVNISQGAWSFEDWLLSKTPGTETSATHVVLRNLGVTFGLNDLPFPLVSHPSRRERDGKWNSGQFLLLSESSNKMLTSPTFDFRFLIRLKTAVHSFTL